MPPQRAIPEPEAHITRLRERRERLANEAELLWHWLAVKEAEFYNAPDAPDQDLKVAARRYVETLGVIHTKVWVEASKCDWMITDAQKRIGQLRSSLSDPEHRVNWKPGALSAEASQSKPETLLRILKQIMNHIEERRKALV